MGSADWSFPALLYAAIPQETGTVRRLSMIANGCNSKFQLPRWLISTMGTAYSAETVIGFLQRDIVYVCCMLVMHNSRASYQCTRTLHKMHGHTNNGHV